MASAGSAAFHRRVWRWHFMAGLCVVPFAVILSVTGAIYLFRPQFDAAIERHINSKAAPLVGETLPADALLAAALDAYPGKGLIRLVMPASAEDPTLEAELGGGQGGLTLWIDRSTGEVLHQTPTSGRAMNIVKRIHGTLLSGNAGSLVVEIMASWMIILILTGMYLWWPRGTSWWRVLLPAFPAPSRRETWRRVHGMAGTWLGGLILTVLIFGLPWTQVWGAGYAQVKQLAGVASPGQEWFVTLQSSAPHDAHAGHDMDHGAAGMLWGAGDEAMPAAEPSQQKGVPLQEILSAARPGQYQPPVWVQPPRGENGVWTLRSMGPSRPGRVTVHYDRWSGEEVMRIEFSDHPAIDRFVAQGVAFHEGQLFGFVNQLAGLAAALGVMLLTVSGALMWWRRRPSGRLGVPPMPADRRLSAGFTALVAGMAVLLPMAGVTLVLALVGEAILSRMRQVFRRQTGK